MIKCSDDRDIEREGGEGEGHTTLHYWLSVGLLLPGERRELRRDQR